MKKYFTTRSLSLSLIPMVFSMVLSTTTIWAVNRSFVPTTGNWNVASNWSPSGIPSGSDNVTIGSGKTVTVPAPVNASCRGLTVDGNIIMASGTGWSNNSHSTLEYDAAAVVSSTGSITVNNFAYFTSSTSSITNNGTITISGMATFGVSTPTTPTCTNTNTITINSTGIVYFFGSVSNSGTITNNGRMTGYHTSSALTYSGTFVNPSTGTVGIVQTADYNTSIIGIGGDCIRFNNGMTNNGIMQMELGGDAPCTAGFTDGLTVNGTLTLGASSTLQLPLVNGYNPTSGSITDIIKYTNRSGSFSNASVTLSNGRYANLSYGASAITFAISSTPLPVEFISFDAQITEGGKNQLTWATATEIRSQEYQVERSDDGTKFYQIGTVKAKGSAANYSFIDATPKFGINYYRLKQVDTDGTFTYTKTEAVETGKGKKSIKIFPTTTEGGIFIENETLSNSNVSVFNAMGQLVYANKSTNSVDLSGMTAGMYFVEVQTGNGKVVEKVFKR